MAVLDGVLLGILLVLLLLQLLVLELVVLLLRRQLLLQQAVLGSVLQRLRCGKIPEEWLKPPASCDPAASPAQSCTQTVVTSWACMMPAAVGRLLFSCKLGQRTVEAHHTAQARSPTDPPY